MAEATAVWTSSIRKYEARVDSFQLTRLWIDAFREVQMHRRQLISRRQLGGNFSSGSDPRSISRPDLFIPRSDCDAVRNNDLMFTAEHAVGASGLESCFRGDCTVSAYKHDRRT